MVNFTILPNYSESHKLMDAFLCLCVHFEKHTKSSYISLKFSLILPPSITTKNMLQYLGFSPQLIISYHSEPTVLLETDYNHETPTIATDVVTWHER